MSNAGLGDGFIPRITWLTQVSDTAKNVILKNDGSIYCLSLNVGGLDFSTYILTKYPSAGINQYISSPNSITGPINQYPPQSFPQLNQM